MTAPRVLLHLASARPHMGGGAISMWRVAEWFRAQGYPVRVTASQVMSGKVRGTPVSYLSPADVRWSDVILTTAGAGGDAVYHQIRKVPRPVVAFAHSATRPLNVRGAELLVWGSAALRSRMREKGFRAACAEMVLWPPFDPESVRVDAPGDCVTLVNLMAEKGADLFWRIVERMPDVRFLGVRGGWNPGRQVIPNPVPANAEVMKHSPDPRDAYRRTRVLLYMRGPDAGPDWLNGVGLAAMEAAVSGIPTVAHPGAGLVESLGDAGVWVDSNDPADWEDAIRGVLADYAPHSYGARERAAAHDPEADMQRLEAAVLALLPDAAEVA